MHGGYVMFMQKKRCFHPFVKHSCCLHLITVFAAHLEEKEKYFKKSLTSMQRRARKNSIQHYQNPNNWQNKLIYLNSWQRLKTAKGRRKINYLSS